MSRSADRSDLGLTGERLAERHLKQHRHKILARRYNTPVGELDLVTRDGDTIVFVEVKTQRDRRFKEPYEQVNAAKQRKLIKAARFYVQSTRRSEGLFRFDVISVVIPQTGSPDVEHFPDAFAPERW